MHFALMDDKKIKAELGLKGLYPGCSQPVIAKCGTERVYHWAHQANNAGTLFSGGCKESKENVKPEVGLGLRFRP